MTASKDLPLSGVRVLDLTNIVSGPMATSILADQGAEVIKVEQPGIGDLTRYMGPARGGLASIFTTINRNKRSIAINLRTEEGKALLYRMVESADVLVQNFRPGVVDRMGIGHEEMMRRNPKLIYASVSGFGDSGPYVKQRVYDVVVQALSGLAGSQTDQDGKPQLIRNIVCDKATAIAAAQTICAALYGRERSGQGRHIVVSMLDVSVAFAWPDVMSRHTYVGEDFSNEASISDALTPYPTTDGSVALLTISLEEFHGLARALGQPELITDPRFAELGGLYTNFEELQAILIAAAATLSSEEFLTRLAAEDVPSAPILDPADVHLNEQVRHNGILSETKHPTAGLTRTPNAYAIFDDERASIRTPAPLLGEHTDEVLKELGETTEAIAALRAGEVVA